MKIKGPGSIEGGLQNISPEPEPEPKKGVDAAKQPAPAEVAADKIVTPARTNILSDLAGSKLHTDPHTNAPPTHSNGAGHANFASQVDLGERILTERMRTGMEKMEVDPHTNAPPTHSNGAGHANFAGQVAHGDRILTERMRAGMEKMEVDPHTNAPPTHSNGAGHANFAGQVIDVAQTMRKNIASDIDPQNPGHDDMSPPQPGSQKIRS